MRIRCVKPEFWKDPLVASWGDATRLAYIGLWSVCDDWGRVVWHMEYLRSEIFPYDPRRKMENVVAPFVETKRVLLYEADGETYAHLVNFRKHQKINRSSKPRHPPPPLEIMESYLSTHGGLSEHSLSLHYYFTEHSKLMGLNQESGIRNQGTGISDQEWAVSVVASLRDTGKFPNVTVETVMTATHGMGWAEDVWESIVVEARALPVETVGNPKRWLMAAFGRFEPGNSQKRKSGAVEDDEIDWKALRGPPVEEM